MGRKRRNSKGKRKNEAKRPFSIAFLIAIPGNFALGAIILISLFHLAQFSFGRTGVWALFASGLISLLVIVGTAKISRLRVLVHEIKHAVMVVLTGNSLKSIHVQERTGHVQFGMYRDKLHFGPLISLAPYFFPLFSLPVLMVCIVLDQNYVQPLAMLLGATLATDMSMAYTDLHPHQSDLQKVTGGPFFGLLYLASAHFLWVTICLLWVMAGRNGYVYCAYIVADLLTELAKSIAR